MTQTETAVGQQKLPPFYRKPVLLDRKRHEAFSLTDRGYGFTAGTISIYLNAAEFAMAAKFYPIVFADGEQPTPVAIVGLRDGRNLFVDEHGMWTRHTYIPAYVRRYPFILAGAKDGEKMGLCVDEESYWVAEGAEQPFFKDGERTAVVEDALKLCTAFHRETLATVAFCRALKEHDLLVASRADVTMATGEKSALGGFLTVDQERFAGLADAVFLDWRRRGWLPAVYAHLAAQSNWQVLVNRAAAITAN